MSCAISNWNERFLTDSLGIGCCGSGHIEVRVVLCMASSSLIGGTCARPCCRCQLLICATLNGLIYSAIRFCLFGPRAMLTTARSPRVPSSVNKLSDCTLSMLAARYNQLGIGVIYGKLEPFGANRTRFGVLWHNCRIQSAPSISSFARALCA